MHFRYLFSVILLISLLRYVLVLFYLGKFQFKPIRKLTILLSRSTNFFENSIAMLLP